MMLIKKYWNGFGNKLTGKTFEHNTEHKIAVRKNARPVRKRVPFLHLTKQEAMQKTVMDLVTRDMIEKGESEWRAPLLVIPKPGGGWRVVVDYRGLNKQTIASHICCQRLRKFCRN